VAGLFKKLLGREDAPAAVPAPAAYDTRPGEAAYERLVAAALLLRNLDAELGTAADSIAEREGRLRASAEEYERLAQVAIAGGRTIQAESALASAETAQAALDALAPRTGELTALRLEAESTAARIESEATALRQRLDARAPFADPGPVVAKAEDEAVRLASLARTLSA
jgi:hypothetical protein